MSIQQRDGGPGWARLVCTCLWLPLLMGMAGCAGTPWGERLSSSFPQAENQQPSQGEGPTPGPAAAQAPQSNPPVPVTAPPVPPAAPAAPSTPPKQISKGPVPAAPPAKPRSAAEPRPAAPVPYRVTIRLPQADPSAPAEGVTQALRGAGIPFEVETIERVKGAPPSAPSTSEATPGSAAAPTSRPAPPPR